MMKRFLGIFLFGLAAGIGVPTVPESPQYVPVYGVIDGITIRNINGEMIPFIIDPSAANAYMLQHGTLRRLMTNPVVLMVRDSLNGGRASLYVASNGLGSSVPRDVHDIFTSPQTLPVVFYPPNIPSKDLLQGVTIDRSPKGLSLNSFDNIPWMVMFPKSLFDQSFMNKFKEMGTFEVGADQMRVVEDFAAVDATRAVATEEVDTGVHKGPFGLFNFGDFIAIPVRMFKGGYNYLFRILNGLSNNFAGAPFAPSPLAFPPAPNAPAANPAVETGVAASAASVAAAIPAGEASVAQKE